MARIRKRGNKFQVQVRRKEAEKLPPRKLGKPKPKRRDPFEGLSTRELYMRRPMD